jgi:spore germination protein GerM
MSVIRDLAQKYWYQSPGKDRRLSRRISAELYRYEQIEKALENLLKHPDDEEAQKAARKALRLGTDVDG